MFPFQENGFHDDEDEFGSDIDLKRKQTDEEPEESPETKRARTETAALNKKDKARKRKQEMKRIKRERVLAESIRKGCSQDFIVGGAPCWSPYFTSGRENMDKFLIFYPEKKQKNHKKLQKNQKKSKNLNKCFLVRI